MKIKICCYACGNELTLDQKVNSKGYLIIYPQTCKCKEKIRNVHCYNCHSDITLID